MKSFSIIGAYFSKSKAIGYNNRLPWPKIPEDMKYFNKITSESKHGTINSVIMGKKTFESMNSVPLKNRCNIVVSNSLGSHSPNVTIAKSIDESLSKNSFNGIPIDKRFIIGGENIFKEGLLHEKCEKLYITEIEEFDTDKYDKFFPVIPEWFRPVKNNEIISESGKRKLKFVEYENKLDALSQENSYLECLKDILEHGEKIRDRTGIGTRSLFCKNMKFDLKPLNPEESDMTKLKYVVPALTTKKMFFNGIIWELLWFLNGNTDVTWLKDRKVKIWDGNSTREYLDSIGLKNVPTNNIGKGYGYQWVNWNGQNINQIKNIIDTLRKNPESRRIILSAWNVGQLHEMALPPCHMMYIFKVTNHDKKIKTLNCQVILRSNDMFLGSPFNILSTAFLTILISRCVNMHPGSIALNITDAHIYENHIDQVIEQLKRKPYKFPYLEIPKQTFEYEDICKLTKDDFIIKDYYNHPALTGVMAV